MKYRLVVRPEVDADLLQAEDWYEQQQAGLGREFLQAIREKLASLPHNPLLYRIGSRRWQMRWAYPDRFPYRIIFRVIQDTIVVYAVACSGRLTADWREERENQCLMISLHEKAAATAVGHARKRRPGACGKCTR